MQDSDLDDLFASARAAGPMPSAALVARIEADALAVQQARQVPLRAPAPRSRLSGWIAALGGSGVMAGLATATLAGLWLGVVQPAPVSAVTQSLGAALGVDAGLDSVELIPALDAFGEEG